MTIGSGTVLLGLNGVLMMGTAGTAATTELKNVRDVELKLSWATEDATTRESGDVEVSVKTVKKVELSWKMLNIKSHADVTTVRAAFLSAGAVSIKCLDEESGWGVDGDFLVTEVGTPQPGKGLQEISVTAVPAYSSRKCVVGPTGA